MNRLATLPKRKAKFIAPMECAPVPKLLDGPGWFYEIKLDGYRAIAVTADGRVNLFSRRHKSFNHQYPHLVEALGELPEGTVVDGEVVALDESGRPNFNLLAQVRREASPVRHPIFAFLATLLNSVPLPPSECQFTAAGAVEERFPLELGGTFTLGTFGTIGLGTSGTFGLRGQRPACSRKWMSVHATFALVAKKIEGSSQQQSDSPPRLEESFPQGAGKSPFSLDTYLSWMSPFAPRRNRVFHQLQGTEFLSRS